MKIADGGAPKRVADESGATLLEFALISPVLLFLMMAIAEIGLAMTAQFLMEGALQSSSRIGRTGYVAADTTREETIRRELHRLADIIIDPEKVRISSYAYEDFASIGEPEPFVDANANGIRDDGENYTDLNGNGRYDLDRGVSGYGGSRAVVVYTVTYPWRFVTPLIGPLFGEDRTITLTARAAVKNEPY
ncbi:TadE/TadG family type IV pilus assembly protein [Faunimonas sp. B44]|uniref:TadE/TadG family type IV pilus assembly protein n=1 Tax=Faunimonas sp. B44 TaxID=3461493 RepID=UPI004044F171